MNKRHWLVRAAASSRERANHEFHSSKIRRLACPQEKSASSVPPAPMYTHIDAIERLHGPLLVDVLDVTHGLCCVFGRWSGGLQVGAGDRHVHVPSHCLLQTSGLAVAYLLYFISDGRELTCPSMPIISAIRKTDKANYRILSGPQHIL